MNNQASAPINTENYLLRSVHTNNFPNILDQLGISLVVSTYQAGKLIVLRADNGVINTHFRTFNKPMGLAANHEKIALGTAYQIWDFRNVPAVAGKIEPQGKHDACYLPRNIHITGDIDIHEMAWAKDELWFINTRFSCLCTLGHPNSFVPRWRPPFITGYDLTDRCHLNGLCLKNDQPKYATALGETDTSAGWRKNKANGGILMDIETNEILIRGLSMPHSPRWYQEQLWLLESGNGSLAKVDLNQRKLETIAKLPGFTRGIDFWGNLAFIGLSQVRETAVFTGMPITQLQERICGVWVVNILTGETVAFLRFEAGVQEIFSVAVLPNIRFPEIIEWNENLLASSYVLPDEALAETVKPTSEIAMAETHLVKGNQLYQEGKLLEAIAAYQECLKLQPDLTRAKYNLGVALGDNQQYEAAINFLQEVINTEPDNADAHNSLAYAYSQKGELEGAIKHYEKAINLNGSFAKAHFNLGMTLLKNGDLKRGFAESEWRWQTSEFTPFQCPHPRWKGEDISNKTLLVHTEQGAGDAIQFIRYIPLAAKRCQNIILVCPPELIPLFKNIPEIDKLMPPGELQLSEFDIYVPLMSLPYIFVTTLETIPDDIPYLQFTNSHHINITNTEYKVGIVWGGSPTHKNDYNRSCKITDFLPILQVPGVKFYSLQKGERTKELTQLSSNIQIEDLGSQLNNYADTAGVIEQLDLVITVDTSVAHLAGALGKNVWTLLCFNPDWRWLQEGKNTPWYPTMKLFRQSESREWQEVVEKVEEELQKIMTSKMIISVE
ncbi:TIGR03032 family protein [Dapis sp. BLCC M126]|uniref:TIGR03032 family protein n=1 Tax=Dapis sp. BLCC M126 TaxID=3400189 RepID=UPI003CF9290F